MLPSQGLSLLSRVSRSQDGGMIVMMGALPVDERSGESDLRRDVASLLRLGPRKGVARFVKESGTDDDADSLARCENKAGIE